MTTSRRNIRRVLKGLSLGAALLVAVMLGRTATYGSTRPTAEPEPRAAVPLGASERLAGAIRIPTLSNEDPAAFDAEAFQRLHAHLQDSFPRVHSHLRRETVATHSLLYTWPGSVPSLKPILLMGHLDVVPVEPGTRDRWQADPFGGRIADGFIWGRGAIDNKAAVVGILEAAEALLGEGFRPERTVYFAFGHDEEVGGTGGARAIAALLRSRGIELEMVLDEGGVIGDGLLPGIAGPVALIGVAEKGFVSVELTARAPGGHSSLPPPQGAVGILGAAVARLESRPMEARLDGPTRGMFDRIGPELPIAQRFIFANLWITSPLVTRKLAASPTTNAMIRTTAAVTIIQGGTKDNVLPTQARAVVNFRIAPGDSIESVLEHVRRVVNDDRVEVRKGGRFSAEPSPVSSATSDRFRRLEGAVRRVLPDALVAPYLVVVATDARHFQDLGADIFRLLPVRVAPADLERMHGINERIGVKEYEDAIRIYRRILIDEAGP